MSGKLGDSRTLRGKRTRLIFPASGLANEMARERLIRTYFARPRGQQWVGFPRGAFCRPLPTHSLMLISLTFILAEKASVPFCMLNAE